MGISLFDKLETINESSSYNAKRLFSELIYIKKISEMNHNSFDELIEKAVNFAYDYFQKTCSITDECINKTEEILMPLKSEAKKYKLYFVAHAHIDMNWMWGYNETVSICLDTFRTILKLMEEYPDFIFSQSQAAVYKIVEEFDSEMFAEIQKRVLEGRWEITASTWVEADKNMPSGESLCRQILYTKRYLKEKFQISYDELSLDFEPDTFGHNSSVPEILTKGKVKYYYHCRGEAELYLYRWQSDSGAEILTYRDPFCYNDEILPKDIEGIPELCDKYKTNIFMKVYGVGDHGGGPTRRDIERILDMKTWAIAPTIEFSTYQKFFCEIEKFKESFPIVKTERNYVFTGCYSSQSRIKMANRLAEDKLFAAESFSALASVYTGAQKHVKNYRDAWEKTLFNQFHDILPGSGVVETREHALGLFQEIVAHTNAGTTKALTEFAKNIDTSTIEQIIDKTSNSEGGGAAHPNKSSDRFVTLPAERGGGKTRIFHVFNPTQYQREETTEITVWDWNVRDDLIEVTDSSGAPVSGKMIEPNGVGWGHNFKIIAIYAKVKPFGYSTYILKEKSREKYNIAYPAFQRTEHYPKNILENEHIKAVFSDTDMTLISLTDKSTGKELISAPSGIFKFARLTNTVGTLWNGNAWVEGFEMNSKSLNETCGVIIEQRDYGNPVRLKIVYTMKFFSSNLRVELTLDKNARYLKYNVTCDWHEISNGDGIPALYFEAIPAYKVKDYIYETPFAAIKRDEVNHDVPARSFGYAENKDGNGICLLTNSVYAYRGDQNKLSVTLIRASGFPDPYPEYGAHQFNIGIGICASGNEKLFEMATSFIQPLHYISNTSHSGTLPLENSLLAVSGNIVVSALKLCEDSTDAIVRVFGMNGDFYNAFIEMKKTIKSAKIVDILEEETNYPCEIKENKVLFKIKQNEILTLKITF